METSHLALKALADDDADAFLRAMTPDLSAKLAQPLVDVSEAQEIRCRLPRSHRKWGFVSLQFGYAIHLAILLQAVRVLESLLTHSSKHIAQLENDGSTVLHTIAKCQMYAPRFKYAKRLETILINALIGEPLLMERLLTQEDSSGLRPLEACVKFAAFRLARKVLHLPNYLVKSETRCGGWAVRLYDLTDYDLCHGSRCNVSPMLILTYMASSQVDSLKKSKLLKDPLIRQWLRVIIRQTRVITFIRLLLMSLPSVLFLVTVINDSVMILVSCSGILIHCNRATFTNAIASGLNATDLYNESLYNQYFDQQIVKRKACSDILDWTYYSLMLILVVTIFLGLTVVVKFIISIYDRSQILKLLTAENWTVTNRFVRRIVFDGYHIMALTFGICYVTTTFLTLWSHDIQNVLAPLNANYGVLIEQLFIGSNTLFISFTLLHFAQYLEIVTKSIGKLFFICHCMLSSFLAALPLLFYWTILFSLVFFILVNTPDFETGLLSLYSSVKLILSMITFDSSSAMVLIIHVLFFVFVGLNLLNFLIAFVTETFLQCIKDFEIAFDLLKLLAALKTFRYFGFLFRWSHWLEVRSQGECKRHMVIQVMQPAFKISCRNKLEIKFNGMRSFQSTFKCRQVGSLGNGNLEL